MSEQRRTANPGNFAEDREKASRAGQLGGQHSSGNFAHNRERAAEAGRKGGERSRGGGGAGHNPGNFAQNRQGHPRPAAGAVSSGGVAATSRGTTPMPTQWHPMPLGWHGVVPRLRAPPLTAAHRPCGRPGTPLLRISEQSYPDPARPPPPPRLRSPPTLCTGFSRPLGSPNCAARRADRPARPFRDPLRSYRDSPVPLCWDISALLTLRAPPSRLLPSAPSTSRRRWGCLHDYREAGATHLLCRATRLRGRALQMINIHSRMHA